MDRNRVTVRYAKALVELAIDQGALEKIDSDIRLLFTALDQLKDFADFIVNPSQKGRLKLESIQTTFGENFQPLTITFLQLIFENKREEFLKDICRNFIHFAKKHNGVITASLTTAYEINNDLVAQIKNKFEQKLSSLIELSTKVDPHIMGGFIFTIDGQQYDASLSTKINSIKKHLNINI